MADIVSVSRTDLSQRRQKLRRQRHMKIFFAFWRTLAIGGLASGLLWVAIQPIWVLHDPKQIVIKSGNQVLPEAEIKSMLVLSYPQSLWRLKPDAIADSLKKQPTIAQATVNRRLFPPGLIIEIQERVPVAIAQKPKASNAVNSNKQVSTGLLDADGVWIPSEKYTLVNPDFKLPSLKVMGVPEKYRRYWSQLYPSLSQSSVKIIAVDFQDLSNVILKTEIGKVHLGDPSQVSPEQINVLAKMRHLPAKINPDQIEYIDLKNPRTPIVHMNQKEPKVNS
jgi:cell division protein FtsQ